MKIKSITRFLFLNATILAIIIAFAAGFVLSEFFRNSSEESFDEQLDIVLKILVGDLAQQLVSGEPLTPPQNLGEPRYELPLSGWYWTLSDAENGKILLSSSSLVGGAIEDAGNEAGESVAGLERSFYATGPDANRLRVLQRKISFSPDQKYLVRVTGNAEALMERVHGFQRKAWMIMMIFGGILLVASFFLVRTALRPLLVLREQVRNVAQGHSELIEGSYPIEVSGLVNETNMLITSNKDTLERARTQVGNLAHALKTPLSIITNETRDTKLEKNGLLSQQANIMRDQIQLYLERARMAARRNVIGSVTECLPVLDKLVSVMQKIHREKTIQFHNQASAETAFRGEQHDLEEMVGNLIDNACKWACQKVEITLKPGKNILTSKDKGQDNSGKDHWLTIIVDDDGAGMNDHEMQLATKRGQRLDESKPGTGLGLSIVEEMSDLYQGQFFLQGSPLGGVRAILVLPAVTDYVSKENQA